MRTQILNASILARCVVCLAIVGFIPAYGFAQNAANTSGNKFFSSEEQRASSLNASSVQPSETTVLTIDPNILVLRAIHQSVFGPPIACKVFQSSRAYNQQVVVSGEYKANGGGTGQFRYTARVSSGETTLDTIQVSDGRLMYTQVGVNEPPRKVYIEKVREAVGPALAYANDRPEVSMYLAIGGHPELLRNLYHRYLWNKGVEGKLGGVEVWQLVGRLRTEPPKIAGNARMDHEAVAAITPDTKLPEIVRLTLGRSAAMAYFPYMVEYYRRTPNPDDPPDTLEPVSTLWHTDATTSVNLSEKDFVYKVLDTVDRIDDETGLYKPQATISVAGLPFLPLK